MAKKVEKIQYWSIFPILSKQAQYNIIFGEDLTFHFRSLYEPPYKEDYLDDDFDPENLTPEQKICNEIADLLRHTNLKPTHRNG